MTTCTRCGHHVEVGRFCTNCGAPVGADGAGPGDTAERPAVRVTPSPPPPSSLPQPTRYPLFADEVEGPVREADDTGPVPMRPADEPRPGPPAHRGGTRWLVWIVTAAVLVVVGLVGATLLLADGGDDDERADDPSTSAASDEPADEKPGDEKPGDEKPTGGGADGSEEPDPDGADATAEVPATAPPGTDVDGTRISYDADKMLDGDPGTCWRMTGDGTGEEIVVRLAEPTLVSELGLINGYAKTASDARGRELDWYAGNRRILAVEWVLDDGTTVEQDLEETRDLQTVEIDPVETSTIVLRLVEVSKPGKGRSARDNTAISELSVVGTPPG